MESSFADESGISIYNMSQSSSSDNDVSEAAHYWAAPVVENTDDSLSHSFVSGPNNVSVASVPISSMDPGWTPSPIIPPLHDGGSSPETKAKPKVTPDGGRRSAFQDGPRVDARLQDMSKGMLRQLQETQTPLQLPISLEQAFPYQSRNNQLTQMKRRW